MKRSAFKPKPTWKRLEPISKNKRRARFRFVPPDILKQVKERSGGQCERMMKSEFNDMQRCPYEAMSQPHHILPRSQGGTHTLDNLLDLCIECHRFSHVSVQRAIREGILKPYRGFIQGSLED